MMTSQQLKTWLRKHPALFYLAGIVLLKRHVIQMAWLRLSVAASTFGFCLSKSIHGRKCTVVLKTLNGVDIAYDRTRPDGGIHPKFVYETVYEGEVLDEIRKRFRADSLFIDVGANLGLHSIAAIQDSETGRVLAVEADKATFTQLERNLLINECSDRVMPVHAALWSEQATLIWENEHSEHGHNYATKALGQHPSNCTTQGMTLDFLTAQYGRQLSISLIKVDVEGAELEVLRGGVKTLMTHRPALIIEIEDEYLKRNGGSGAAIEKFLASLGYRSGIAIHNEAFGSANNFIFEHG